ncbi:hypothetical protein [Ekhidna sp.]|uniref:hypothetical protein n=1 Tax=Ekhidna sp. TaxID=2608089 RepID=UPI003B4FFD8B
MNFRKLVKSATFNTWFSNGVTLLNGLIAIPIVVTKLTVEEINVWFLFSAVVTISQGVLFGFSGTFTRFISYSFGGVKINEFLTLKDKLSLGFSSTYDKGELSRILSLLIRLYTILSLVQLILLAIGGYFALMDPISKMDSPHLGWISWTIVILSSSFNLYLGSYKVFLEGINRVDLTQRIIGITNLIGLVLIIVVLFSYPSLLSIVLVYQFILIAASLITAIYYKRTFNQLGIKALESRFDKSLFIVVWDSAWKSGITVVISAVVKNISSILVAQLFSPQAASPFLLTKRVFDILERFTSATFQSKIPVISRLRGRGDFERLIPTILRVQYLSFGVFILGYISLLFFGDKILALIDSNVGLGSIELIMLFSISAFLNRWSGFGLAISNQANQVIEHINATLVLIVFFSVFFIGYESWGVLIFPVAQTIAILFTVPLLIKRVYKTMGTTFLRFEKNLLLPLLSVVVLINIIYYILFT